jgi:hypothetical protein
MESLKKSGVEQPEGFQKVGQQVGVGNQGRKRKARGAPWLTIRFLSASPQPPKSVTFHKNKTSHFSIRRKPNPESAATSTSSSPANKSPSPRAAMGEGIIRQSDFLTTGSSEAVAEGSGSTPVPGVIVPAGQTLGEAAGEIRP